MLEEGPSKKNLPFSASGILKRYLEEISREQLLTPAEEIELAIRVKNGDPEALDKFLRANLRFVVSVAKKYQNHGLSLEDLINEGNIGLIKAAKRYDETRGFKFISYAVWWIRQTILQAISEYARLVRLPLNVVGNINKISKAKANFERDFEREPTEEEIEEILWNENIDLDLTRQLSEKPLSIDSPLTQDNSCTLQDVIPGQEEFDPVFHINEESFQLEIQQALNTLEKREAEVLRRYFGIGQESPESLEQIGAALNLTRERVRQIKEKALRKLRHSSRTFYLRGYLG